MGEVVSDYLCDVWQSTFPNILSGSLVGNSPTSNKSGNTRIQLHPKLGEKLRANLARSCELTEFLLKARQIAHELFSVTSA
mgnify:CR=1 FL=1